MTLRQIRLLTTSAIAGVVVLGCVLPASAGRPVEKPKAQLVDTGSFGVFVEGRRVATESFKIQQGGDVSIASSDFKLDDGSKAAQHAELQLTPSGDLRRYEWHELSPGKAVAVVEPNADFLMEHVTPNPPAHPSEHPFILPASTLVLDDYFFSHRQILAWRYLAQGCAGKIAECRPGKLQFGVLVPTQRSSMQVAMEFTGVEKVTIHGTQQELSRINLTTETGNWVLWLDGNLRLVRILIPEDKTEVLRD